MTISRFAILFMFVGASLTACGDDSANTREVMASESTKPPLDSEAPDGGEEPPYIPPPDAKSPTFEEEWVAQALDYNNPRVDDANVFTDVAVLGKVAAVDNLRWNTSTGERPDQLDGAFYRQIRSVSFTVDAILWRREGTPEITLGELIEVIVTGDGRSGGPEVSGLPPVTSLNQLGGFFEQGDVKLLYLAGRGYPNAHSDGDAVGEWTLAFQFLSNFDVQGAVATNSVRPEYKVQLSTVHDYFSTLPPSDVFTREGSDAGD